MESRDQESAEDQPSRDSPPKASPSPPLGLREQTPTDNDLARALLSLSFSDRSAPNTTATGGTPLSRPSSSQLPGSYPETPLPATRQQETFYTPSKQPLQSQTIKHPSLSSLETSPEPERVFISPPKSSFYPSPSPEPSPEPSIAPKTRTVVVLHDSCTKHKFSRNAKARELASIVERPERCRASILGIAAAKARLDMKEFIDLTFDIVKSDRFGELSDPAVQDVHGTEWPPELTALCDSAVNKLAKGDLEIPPPYHSGDLYLGEGSLEAFRGCIGAVYDAVDRVLANGYDRAHVSIRPPGHHCAETMPSGFCMINNVHVAIAYAHRHYGITRAVILDFDLHHGDGSQAIAWKINERTNKIGQASHSPKHSSTAPGLRIGYFSLHDIYSFPCEDGAAQKVQDASLCLNAHGQTIWNVHLRHHSTDAAFDEIYDSDYYTLFRRAGDFLASSGPNDKCMVFLSAGFDASEYETKGMQRHGYNLPTHFYQRFASDAIALADRFASGKLLSVLEGGYADRAITSGSFAYMVGLAGVDEESTSRKSSEWWSVPRLTMLEKCTKKHTALKSNGSQNENDISWVQNSLSIATFLLSSAFAPFEAGIDPSLLATPRMGLRERKKPVVLSTAPPSTVKKRQQRAATPRARKSLPAAETFIQDPDAPPPPKPFERDTSPSTGLSALLHNMNIREESDHSLISSEKPVASEPGTPTPVRNGVQGGGVL
jgi:acetoin utilization deacetylase AcuC-like enzyme